MFTEQMNEEVGGIRADIKTSFKDSNLHACFETQNCNSFNNVILGSETLSDLQEKLLAFFGVGIVKYN